MKTKPDLSTAKLWYLSFGFLGVQIAFGLQSANLSRIFSTLGADPTKLGYFWMLPPLMGMIVQPLVGLFSDKTWNRFGRRIPYLFVGTAVAVLVMAFLPNSGNLGLSVAAAMIFGAIMFMLLDTSINMAMQPFKMMVGDMVNEKQKTRAYSIQSFLCNAGGFIAYLLPFFLTAVGVANTAADGVVPDSVKWSFYGGAAVMALCVLVTVMKIKEYTPSQMAEFRDNTAQTDSQSKGFDKSKAVKVFMQVALVQFFCWVAFQCMYVYSHNAISEVAFGVDTLVENFKDIQKNEYQAAGNWNGILLAVMSAASIMWAVMLPKFKNIKIAYSLSLVIGAVGFLIMPYFTNKWALFVPYFMAGFAWAAMLALPFTIVTNAFEGSKRMGTVLGLFNCSICIPQIVLGAVGGSMLEHWFGNHNASMIVFAGVVLLVGAISVFFISNKHKDVANA